VELAIGEVAQRAGVETSAIRYYERIGLLPRPERRNGRRVYDAAVLDRLHAIALAKEAGFSLAEIHTLVRGFSDSVPLSARWRALAEQKLEEIDAMVARAEAMRAVLRRGLECDCVSLEDCRLLSS
jgi:MerR family redox-sensitive transcriptional activator SoxR